MELQPSNGPKWAKEYATNKTKTDRPDVPVDEQLDPEVISFHKTANVLNKMPKSVQPKAKADLHEIWQAETKDDANQAFDNFLEKYGAKYARACECLKKDRDVLLTFYDIPAERWSHLRTTNPIESTFATIRLRHRKAKGERQRHTTSEFGNDVQARSVRLQEMETV